MVVKEVVHNKKPALVVSFPGARGHMLIPLIGGGRPVWVKEEEVVAWC